MRCPKPKINALYVILGAMIIIGCLGIVKNSYATDIIDIEELTSSTCDATTTSIIIYTPNHYNISGVSLYGATEEEDTEVAIRFDIYNENNSLISTKYFASDEDYFPKWNTIDDYDFYFLVPTLYNASTTKKIVITYTTNPEEEYVCIIQATGILWYKIWYESESDYSTIPENEFYWYWPNDGYELSNYDWSDYALYYKLGLSTWEEVVIRITSTHESGLSWFHAEEVSTTTNLTMWVIDRTEFIPDGSVYSQAELLGKIGTEWYSLGDENINWISSTTGYTLDDNPYLPQAGFYETIETIEDWNYLSSSTNIIGSLWNKMTYVFPISLIADISKKIAYYDNYSTTTITLSLANLTGNNEQLRSVLGDTYDTELINTDLVEDTPNWENIYELMEMFIYLIGFFYLLFRFYPKLQHIGGNITNEPIRQVTRDRIVTPAEKRKMLKAKNNTIYKY